MACSRVNFTLHIGGRSSIRNLRTRHAVVTGTHLSRNSLHTKRRNAEWIGLLEGVTEGRIEVMRKQGRWRKRIQNDLQERRRFWNLKQEALARTLWRTRCGIGYTDLLQGRLRNERMDELTLWRWNYFFLILAHPVYKMWIIQEPNKLALWNKLHFEEKKRRVKSMFKIFSTYICWINI